MLPVECFDFILYWLWESVNGGVEQPLHQFQLLSIPTQLQKSQEFLDFWDV